jgi:hypothetical protein
MSPGELSGPDLAGVVSDAEAAGLQHVVIGGFSVIYHGYVRATQDIDLLVPDGPEADEAVLRFLARVDGRRLRDDRQLTREEVSQTEYLRIATRHGIVDILRGGLPPLDYETVAANADTADWDGLRFQIASLPSVVGFKRLAGRPRDRADLAELEAIHRQLPIQPIPGLDK